jgi:hypothetical protein
MVQTASYFNYKLKNQTLKVVFRGLSARWLAWPFDFDFLDLKDSLISGVGTESRIKGAMPMRHQLQDHVTVDWTLPLGSLVTWSFDTWAKCHVT